MRHPEVAPQLKDFRNFLFLCWKYLGLPEPTPVQYDIAYSLQHGIIPGSQRDIIEAFRGVGKSWITAAFVCWLLYIDPQRKILIVSASKNLADNFTTFVLQLIHGMELLAHLQPGNDQREAKVQFDVGPARASKDPSVKSVGITGQLTGSRADIIISDDVEVPGNSLTQMMRDKLSEAVKEFDAIITPKLTSRVIVLGTPQCEQSLYNLLLNERGYVARIWPARYPDAQRMGNYGNNLAPMIAAAVAADPLKVGHSTDPKRFTDLDLMKREGSYGKSGFGLQFMLDTKLSDLERYPLKLSDFIAMDLDPEVGHEKVVWAGSRDYDDKDLPAIGFAGDRWKKPMSLVGAMIPYQDSVLFIDPSGRGKDETGYAVVKLLNGQLFVTELGGLSGGYDDETLQQLAVVAKRQQVHRVIIESNFGDGMFTKLITPVLAKAYPVTVEEVRSSTNKEARIIDTLEPLLNRHKLVIDRKVIQQDYDETQAGDATAIHYSFAYQLTRICKERGALRHDDRLDALEGACKAFHEAMDRDVDQAVSDRKDELLEHSLRSHEEYIDDMTVTIGAEATWSGLTWA